MTEDKEFQKKIQRIGELVSELENIADAELRTRAKALVQLLLDLHSAGIERMIEIVAKSGDSGQQTIDHLGSDPLVSSLMVLYGLHPLDFESRVAQAVEKISRRVRKGGGELRLISSEGGVVRVHVQVISHACGSTGKTIEKMVEDALYEAAPDIDELIIDGLDGDAGSSGFVPVGTLGGVIAAAR